MRTPLGVKVQVTGGRHLSRANMCRIRALDRRIDTCHVGPGTLANYKPEYRLIHDRKKGFAWVEVYYGSGMCGWCPSIRVAVIRAATHGMMVEMMDVWAPPTCPTPPASFRRHDLACWGQIPDFTSAS